MSRTGRALALMFAVVALAGVLTVTAGAQASDLSLEVVDRSPWVDVGGTFTLDVAVSDEVDAVSVRVHGLLESSEELADSHDADEGPVIFTGIFPVDDAEPVTADTVRFSFDISDTVNDGATIRMAYAGVYPVVVAPLDADGNAGEPTRTPVIRRSGAGTTLAAPDLSVIVDVSTRPTATAEGRRRSFEPDELARFGRLGRFLERAVDRGLPISALVNTDTLDALGESEDPAAALLHRALTAPGLVVIPQPTVPLDWPVLTAAGLDHLIGDLIQRGREAMASVEGRVDDATWDATGGVDDASLNAIASAGFTRVLVNPTRSELFEEAAVPRDRFVVGGPEDLDVVAVDAAMSSRLTTETSHPDAGLVTLADLVLRGSDTTTAVVIDDVADGSGLAAVVDLVSEPDSPVSIVPLDSESEDRSVVVPAAPHIVDMAEMTDLAAAIAEAVESLELYDAVTSDADTNEVIEAAGAMLAGTVQRGLDRSDRTLLIAGVAELTSWVADDLRFVGPGNLNLTSRTGTLPIGVLNEGDTTVTLILAARSDRLDFPEGAEIVFEIVPGESRLDLPVVALASGSVPLYVELRGPDGSIVVPTRQYNVRSTAISGMGLVLSIGALAVLVVWWFRTWRKSRRQRV